MEGVKLYTGGEELKRAAAALAGPSFRDRESQVCLVCLYKYDVAPAAPPICPVVLFHLVALDTNLGSVVVFVHLIERLSMRYSIRVTCS